MRQGMQRQIDFCILWVECNLTFTKLFVFMFSRKVDKDPVTSVRNEDIASFGVLAHLDVLHGLGHGDALDAGLPPQLLHHHPLLLHVGHPGL